MMVYALSGLIGAIGFVLARYGVRLRVLSED